jgi:hypothetical protein
MKKRTWKEKIIMASVLLFFMIVPALAGIVGKSEYDVVYTITVIDCQGSATVYRDCRLINTGQDWVSFMPNQGQIATGNGKAIHVSMRDGCTRVIKEEV